MYCDRVGCNRRFQPKTKRKHDLECTFHRCRAGCGFAGTAVDVLYHSCRRAYKSRTLKDKFRAQAKAHVKFSLGAAQAALLPNHARQASTSEICTNMTSLVESVKTNARRLTRYRNDPQRAAAARCRLTQSMKELCSAAEAASHTAILGSDEDPWYSQALSIAVTSGFGVMILGLCDMLDQKGLKLDDEVDDVSESNKGPDSELTGGDEWETELEEAENGYASLSDGEDSTEAEEGAAVHAEVSDDEEENASPPRPSSRSVRYRQCPPDASQITQTVRNRISAQRRGSARFMQDRPSIGPSAEDLGSPGTRHPGDIFAPSSVPSASYDLSSASSGPVSSSSPVKSKATFHTTASAFVQRLADSTLQGDELIKSGLPAQVNLAKVFEESRAKVFKRKSDIGNDGVDSAKKAKFGGPYSS